MKKVWVVAFEPLEPNGVGGFDWFYELSDMLRCVNGYHFSGDVPDPSGYTYHLFAHETSIEGTEQADRDRITAEIDRRVWESQFALAEPQT